MPKKEGSNDQKLKDLYDKFQSPEFREELKTVIENKGGKDMEYVPWSNVMNRFFKACPTAEYKFHEYSIEAWDNEGKMVAKRTLPYTGDSKHGYFVSTSITCFGITRSMHSAIYGKNFFAVNLNPTSNQVHNAQMRCLCKNAAMFGLGIELWTREEIAQLEAEEKQPKKEETPEKEETKGKWTPDDGAPEPPEEETTLPEIKMGEILDLAVNLFEGKEITHPHLNQAQLTLVENKLAKLDSKLRKKFDKKHPDIIKFKEVKEITSAIKDL